MIFWLDLETTGLEVDTCSILEVGYAVTDDDLNIITEGNTIVRARHLDLERMDPYVRDMHTKNGLLELSETVGLRNYEAEQLIIDRVSHLVDPQTPVAGNTIGFDRVFLKENMPKLHSLFHYRSIDVTGFNEVAARWHKKIHQGRPRSVEIHRALPDVMNSIETLRYYREKFFG